MSPDKSSCSAGICAGSLIALIMLLGCQSIPGPADRPTGALLDTLLSPSQAYEFIPAPGIAISIPQGAVGENVRFSIAIPDPSKLGLDSSLSFFTIFDVTLGTGSRFLKPVTITLRYDKTKLPATPLQRIGAAYYSDTLKRWLPFSEVAVDTAEQCVTVTTDHLCKLGAYGWRNLLGFTHWESSLHFDLYYTEGTVPTNSEYDSPYKNVNSGSSPHYVQDILYYLEQAYTAYKNANLQLPQSGRIEVRLTDLDPDDGKTSYTGMLYINRRIKPDNVAMNAALGSVCAHELFHYVQDYYYMQLFSEYTVKWWLEATATTADYIVWPANDFHEYKTYAGKSLDNVVARSWD
ncbi:MAG: hypothetical protein JXA71_09960, partial [Chitinispirillaceae bacterium]|nr:hypothetical protein [Chitinispirillaceae bacterium]